MITTSKITGITYDSDKVLYITYIPQLTFYFQNGCDSEVVDILYDASRDQQRPLCFVFKYSPKMKELYSQWKVRKEGKDAKEES